MINARIDDMKQQGLLMEEESKVPVRLSTKDQLAAMGINVKMSDGGNSLLGSDDLNPLNDDDYDQFDINLDHLESDDDEEMRIQDNFKGINLSHNAMIKRGEMTQAQRIKWYNDDGLDGKYKMALIEPDRAKLKRNKDRMRKTTKALLD